MKRGCSINEHLNRYTKLLTDLVNVDVEIDDEDKTVILLNSLPVEKYETFTLTLINGRKSLTIMKCQLLLLIMKRGGKTDCLLMRAHQQRHWQ